MNIALSAVVIFILLIPPIAFYFSYSSGSKAKAGPKFSLLDGILASAIISLFVHSIAILFIHDEIRFDILLKVLGGEIKDVENKISNQQFSKGIKQFALYNFIVLVIFILLGRISRWIVIRANLNDGAHELTRLNNRWWYFFNGYENGIEEFDLVFVDAVVDTNDGTIIYSGFLIDYVCNGEDLDRIYLGDTVRREFKISEPSKPAEALSNQAASPFPIPGEIFSLPYKNAINLNLRFIILRDDIGDIQQFSTTTDNVEESSVIPSS